MVAKYMIFTFTESAGLSKTVLPFLVSRVSNGHFQISANDIISVNGESLIKEKDSGITYERQKPVELYSTLLDIFSPDKSLHVLDTCSGAGSCAVACTAAKYKCLVLEKSLTKCRLIEQRLQC